MKTLRWISILLIIALCLSLLTSCGLTGARGEKGETGEQGEKGDSGAPGKDGTPGEDGKSAYELAVDKGYTGTEEEWLMSLIGEKGATGAPGKNGTDGKNGADGRSAYELARAKGYTGTETEWLASLIGAPGKDGKSNYDLAKENGYTGTMQEWLASLVGPKGEKGDKGDVGDKGDPGEPGATWISGETEPENSIGDNNDFYFDTTTCNIYKKKNGVWEYTGNIQGLKGDPGDKGEKGDVGDTGVGILSIVVDYTGRVVITLTDGRIETIEVDASCQHSAFTEHEVLPTCSARGYTVYECVDCGYKYKNNYTPAGGHHYYNRFCVFCHEEQQFGQIEVDTNWYYAGNYTITSREALAGLAYLVNTGVTNFSGTTVKLGADIDLSGVEWVPIGTESQPFSGTFDGQNMTISGMQITTAELTSDIGLFGYVKGTLKNFRVVNANVSTGENGSNIGIACGYSAGVVSGISVSGYLTAEGFTYVGGVLGRSEMTGNSTFSALYNTADITGKEYVGGVIGYMKSYQSGSGGTIMDIEECSNAGKITASGDYVGGLFGYILKDNNYYHNQRLYMIELVNEGDVTTDGSYVGGIVGYVFANSGSYIKTSTSGVSVSGKGYVGGIAGKLENIEINNCNNRGTKVAAKYITEEYSKAYLGGYVGYGDAVKNCNNATEINYEHAAFYVGGIAGYLTGEMSSCVNTAKINAPKASYVGGLLGYSEKTGDSTFTVLHNTADVTGKEYVGGLIGYIRSYQSGSSVTTMNIGKCSNKGKITGSEDYVGGLFGYILKDNDYYHNQRLYMTELTNEGNVSTDGSYVGGIAGYILGNNGSYIKTSASGVSVSGKGYVGGIAGKLENVTIDNCDNSGTALAAKYITEEYSKAYLGGYVGCGYIVRNCNNATEINYEHAAFYVGGIAGYLTGEMSDCTNTAKINAPKASYVGGLLGYSEKTGDSTFTILHNTADVTGKEYVGGVIGYMKSYQSGSGVTTMTMGECSNKGTITANGNYAGGLFGYILKDNDYYHNQKLYMTDMTNEGDVRVVGNYAGGIAGYVYANDGSKLQNYATAGSVSGNLFCDTVIGFISNLEIVAN